jgi:hypothetical protein
MPYGLPLCNFPGARGIGSMSLEFDNVPVRRFDNLGDPYTVYKRVGMPKIPQDVINVAFYLYSTRADAEAGVNPQGTGFLLGIPGGGDLRRYDHVYAVTNWHLAVQKNEAEGIIPASIVRLNAVEGVRILDDLTWHHIDKGPDIAVAPLDLDFSHRSQNHVRIIESGMFASNNDIESQNIGVGEDVFMFGLFVDHGGEEKNAPSARFGNISMLPSIEAPIEQGTGGSCPCFILDMHSRSGVSGSPVFVYRTFGSDLTRVEHHTKIKFGASDMILQGETLFKFLGVHLGQFQEEWEIGTNRRIAESRKKHLVREGEYVVGMSGMTIVIPAWEFEKVLNLPELVKMRKEKDDEEERKQGAKRKAIWKPEKTGKKDT